MKRIQRQRTKGWRLPRGGIYIGRPSIWGNPWALHDLLLGTRPDGTPWTAEDLVRWYRGWVTEILCHHPDFLEPLRGRDLACWCKLTDPCHGDVLLQLLAASA